MCKAGSRRSGGTAHATAATTASVPAPPISTAATGPTSAPISPARSAPISFDEPMNIWFTPVTRPRSASGVRNCTSDDRTTTLTLSHAPLTTSAANDSQNQCDSPKTRIAPPNPATAHSMDRPGRTIGSRCASRMAMTHAPRLGAARSQPRPIGPVCRIWSANTGSSIVAPPSSVAKRSSALAPRITFRLQMNFAPSSQCGLAAGPDAGPPASR